MSKIKTGFIGLYGGIFVKDTRTGTSSQTYRNKGFDGVHWTPEAGYDVTVNSKYDEEYTRSATDAEVAALEKISFMPGVTALVCAGGISNNKNIKQVEFTPGVRTVGQRALAGTGVRTVDFPASIEDFGNAVLAHCSDLEKVSFSANHDIILENFCTHDFNLKTVEFRKSKVKIFGRACFYMCKSLDFQLPNTTEEIWDYAFARTAARYVVIPKSCKRVYSNAFADMPNLERVIVESDDTKLAWDAFAGDKKLREIIINGKQYAVEMMDDVPMTRRSDTTIVNGIQVQQMSYIGDDKIVYCANAGGHIRRCDKQDDAMRYARAALMNAWDKKKFRDLRDADDPAARFHLDMTLQELYCLETAEAINNHNAIEPKSIPHTQVARNILPRKFKYFYLDCTACQQHRTAIYNECQQRYGLGKSK